MALQCRVKTAKVFLAVFNVLFWVVGGVLLVLGAWIFLDNTNERLLLLAAPPSMSAHALFFMAYALLALGLGALIAGVLGCCGALQGSRCLLVSFFGLLLVLLGGAVALTAGALATRVQVLSGLQERLGQQLPLRYNSLRSDNISFSDAVDLAQYKLRCCGVRSFADYENSRWWNESRKSPQFSPPIVPPTCCTLTNDEVAHSGSPLRVVSRVFGGTVEEPWQHPKPKDPNACQREDAPEDIRHKKGCAAGLSAWYQQATVLLVAAAVGTSLFGVSRWLRQSNHI
ncbi:Tetraspanin [Gryllus bimaculatus]|nr:Tetraspanin [Gryllus bimaculatus]